MKTLLTKIINLFPLGHQNSHGFWFGVMAVMVCGMAQAAQVTLLWDAVAGAQGYLLYQGTNSGVYQHSYETTNTSYTVTNLLVGVTYYFAVTAFNDVGESGESNEAQWNSAGGVPVVTLRRYAPVLKAR